MARALYRAYRPTTLQGVIGQDHVTDIIRRSIAAARPSHAYLLTGPRGVGKTSIARIMAHEFNGIEYSESPNMDIIEIDAASNRRIDDIRDLREKVAITPVSARYKVYIIDEVHMLTGESFNALLKTLEEPPAHVIFILATTELHKVPVTILSRTQQFQLRRVSVEDISRQLKFIADAEGIQIDDASIEIIARKGDGSFRDSISLLDQFSSYNGSIDHDLVRRVLGVSPAELVDEFVQIIVDPKNRTTDYIASVLAKTEDSTINIHDLTKAIIKQAIETSGLDQSAFTTVQNLIELPQSSDPLMRFRVEMLRLALCSDDSNSRSSIGVRQSESGSNSTLSQPKPKTPDSRSPITTKAQDTGSSRETVVKSSTGGSSDGVVPFDWAVLLEHCKSRNPSLHSVLNRVTHEIHDDVLRLSCSFSLHRKKLQDPKYRSQLVSMISGLFGEGLSYEIVDQQLPPEFAAAVDIMGGGEVVHV